MSKFQISAAKRVRGLACLFCSLSALLPSGLAQQAAPKRDRSSDEPTPIASTRPLDRVNVGTLTTPNVVHASARLEGTPSPGLAVTLDGSSSSGGRVWYRWLQTQGPKVTIEDPTRAEARFTVPADATQLDFVLVVGNATGVDATTLVVEVEDPDRDLDNAAIKADAGDEQSARVGRRVLLNGVRSEPKGKIAFRWVQTAGPKVSLKASEGPTASFVPSLPGSYQFALVVATTGGLISEAATVKVNVGGTIRASADGPSMRIDELARVSIASIEGGPRYAEDLSRAFDHVADEINTYKNFTEAIGDTTRRLDAVVPRDKERRAIWIEQLFSPLMAQVVAGMKADGLDLSQPAAQARPLTPNQKSRLADQFRYTAAGLRASKTTR